MIKLNQNTPSSDVKGVKEGDEVTDGFQKTGRVVNVEVEDKGNRIEYIFTLDSGSKILIFR